MYGFDLWFCFRMALIVKYNMKKNSKIHSTNCNKNDGSENENESANGGVWKNRFFRKLTIASQEKFLTCDGTNRISSIFRNKTSCICKLSMKDLKSQKELTHFFVTYNFK